MSDTIFVSIASYRDGECPATIADLFAMADQPERVFVGVFWQVVPGDDDDCVYLAPEVPAAQVRSLRVHPSESQGPCWARHRIQAELWQGETFYLQIDSHMRFTSAWDTRLIDMHRRTGSGTAVLATYPVAYRPPDQLGPPAICVLGPKQFDDNGILSLVARSLDPRDGPDKPQPNPFIAAGFLFAPASILTAVPYDPYIYFHGEEISLAVRLWTSGYDLFSPDEHLLYHDYSPDRTRPRHWTDNKNWSVINQRSVARVRHLLGMEVAKDPEAITEMERFGLGSARSLAEYQVYADIDFASRRLGSRALAGRFPMPPSAEPGAMLMRRRFAEIYQHNQWQNPETRSGPGSTRRATTTLRPALSALLAELNIRTLVDAGCGEFGWIEELADKLDWYLGFDLVPDIVDNNNRLTAERPNRLFKTVDFTHRVLPRADAILCRNVLTHLPNADIRRTLALFGLSGSRYLLATLHPHGDNRDIGYGAWRAVDLTREPFGLPRPLGRILDLPGPNGYQMGAWDMTSAGWPALV